MITDGINARAHASGDDTGLIILKRDKEKIKERIRKYATLKSEYKTHGLG